MEFCSRRHISHFHHTHHTGWRDHDRVQATRCMVVEGPVCMYICKAIAYTYVIVSIKDLQFQESSVVIC